MQRTGKHRKVPETKKKKKPSPRVMIAAAVGVAVAVVLLVSFWPRGTSAYNRDPAEMRQMERQGLEAGMQAEIERATARGASQAEINRIRADYQKEINNRAKE
jgi:hypothetical protein